MSDIPRKKLNSGHEVPMIGFGCWGGHDGPEKIYLAVKTALVNGYRHFDTAFIYKNEEAVGRAIQESGIPRQDLFITTKLWQTFHEAQHVIPAFEKSLKYLQLDYIDLYLIHWPLSWAFKGYEYPDIDFSTRNMKVTNVPIIETWHEMEKLVKAGKIRSIGVSNFTISMLEELTSQCEILPAMNQIEIHPAFPQNELVDYCQSKNIAVTAYSPLGNPGYSGKVNVLEEPVILDMSKKYNKSPVQIALNWGVNRGYCVIPKSTTPSRIKDNLTFFQMDHKDIDSITAIGQGRTQRVCNPILMFGPENNIFDC